MGCKRKRSKRNAVSDSSPSQSKVWPDRDVKELLSYLNSQVAILDPAMKTRKKWKIEDVDQEAARHLNRLDRDEASGQLRLQYSTKQVRAQLSQLYAVRKRAGYEGNDLTAIYAEGFACLDWTNDHEQQEQMIHRSNEIKEQWTWEFTYSPRTLRSGPRANGNFRGSSRNAIRAPSSTPDPRRRARSLSVTGRVSRKPKSTMSDVKHKTEPLKTRNVQSPPIQAGNSVQAPSIRKKSGQHGAQQVGLSVQVTRQISDSESELSDAPLSVLRPFRSSMAASKKRFEELPSTQKLEKRLQAAEKGLQAVEMAQKDPYLDVNFWKAKYCVARSEGLKWRRAKDALAAKLNTLQRLDYGNSPSDDLVEHKTLINDLLDERNSHKRIQTSTLNMVAASDDDAISKVLGLMRDIDGRLEIALEDVEFSPMATLETLPQNHLLRPLVEHAFGVEWDSPEAEQLLERWRVTPWLQKYGPLALCGAALALWVFQQTQADILFDQFQHVGTRSSTNRYRDAIRLVGQSDPALARAVDSMVHNSLAEDDCFKEFQKSKAEDLARKLQEALAPLCDLNPSGEEQCDGDSQTDEYTISRLSDVFSSAIDVHCQLVLTGRRYECVWYEPGMPFEGQSMRSYRRKVSDADMSVIGLALLPGINQVTTGVIGVDFGGFTERRYRSFEEAECVVRAVVVHEGADSQ